MTGAGGFIIVGGLVAVIATGGLLWLGARVIDAVDREIAVLFGAGGDGVEVVHAAEDAAETTPVASGSPINLAAPGGWDRAEAEMSHG